MGEEQEQPLEPAEQHAWRVGAFGLTGVYTPYEALASGTVNVAQYFGTSGDTGTIAQGKRADLIPLNANPLANIANTENRAAAVRCETRCLTSRSEQQGRY